MKSNKGLVEYCNKQLNEDTIYVLGTCGWPLTTALLDSKCKQLSWNAEHRAFLQQYVDQGKKAFDCCGLIKAYLWDEGYDASSDEDEAMMYARATEKGHISTMPDIAGVLVFMEGHVGVYVGNGEVIECTPSDAYGWGVQKHALAGRGWTTWAKYARISYDGNVEPKPIEPSHGIGADQVIQVGSKVKLSGAFKIEELLTPEQSGTPNGLVCCYELSNGKPEAYNWLDATPLYECDANGNRCGDNVLKTSEYFACDEVLTVTEITYPTAGEPNGTCSFVLGNREVNCLCDRIYEVSNN